jgi:hypothetical protein
VDERGANGPLHLGHNLGDRPGVGVLGRVAFRLFALRSRYPLPVDLLPPCRQDDRNGPFCRRLVEALAEGLGQAVDDPIVGEEDVVFAEELALRLVRLELCPQVADVDDSADLGTEVLGELVGDGILVPPLRVGRY